MSPAFEYAVTTMVPPDDAWRLFSDVTRWPEISDVYESLNWLGTPWERGSTLYADLKHPERIKFSYLIEYCTPGSFVQYLAHGEALGFAFERQVSFEPIQNGTMIRTSGYDVGKPVRPLKVGEASDFLKQFMTRWLEDFGRYCDLQGKQNIDQRPIPPSNWIQRNS